MSAPFTPDTIRNIGRYAGVLPPQEIANRLGLALSFVQRVAREQGFNLRLMSERPEPPEPVPYIDKPRLPLCERHTATFTINLREADAKLLRDKAHERFVPPARLLRMVFEGAIARGKIDELVTASKIYRPGTVETEKEST